MLMVTYCAKRFGAKGNLNNIGCEKAPSSKFMAGAIKCIVSREVQREEYGRAGGEKLKQGQSQERRPPPRMGMNPLKRSRTLDPDVEGEVS